jgi:antitoxin component of MazEF toxin-antitoxin module
MKTVTATVIKSGNSYALRVPKSYAERNRLRPGAKVILSDPKNSGGTLADLQATIKAARKKGSIRKWDVIGNPIEWQRNQRSSWDN